MICLVMLIIVRYLLKNIQLNYFFFTKYFL